MSRFPQEYDIEMIGSYENQQLKNAHKLVMNLVEIGNKLEFRKTSKAETILFIPVKDIVTVGLVERTKGRVREKNYYLVEILFGERNTVGPQQDTQSVLFKVEDKYLNTVREHIKFLREADTSKFIQRQIKSDLHPKLCAVCFAKEYIVVILSQKLCETCCTNLYERGLLYAKSAEYHGGHKAFLAGGIFAKHETGELLLTETHLIFTRKNNDPLKEIEIVIPLVDVTIEAWNVHEEVRRKELSGGGFAYDNIGLGGLFMHESGKSHRLVVPYVDENGIPQQPAFGVSSFGGKAIRQWAAELYKQVVNAKKTNAVHEQTTRSDLEIENTSMKDRDRSAVIKRTYNSQPISFDKYQMAKKIVENKETTPMIQDRNSESNRTNESNVRINYSELNNQSQQANKQSNDELKHTLKMRLVKGEISKEEYLEILKMIES